MAGAKKASTAVGSPGACAPRVDALRDLIHLSRCFERDFSSHLEGASLLRSRSVMTSSSRIRVLAAVFGLLLAAAPVLAGPAPDAREVATGLAALGPRAEPAARGRAVEYLLDALRRAGLSAVRAL